MLRSNLDARFVMYHHVIRRRVSVELAASFDDPLAAHIDRRWRDKITSGSLFVNDQFVSLVRRPARGKAGLAERVGKLWRTRRARAARGRSQEQRALRAALQSLAASLGDYGAQPLGDYVGPSGNTNNELLELLSALYNGEMRPVRRPDDETDIGRMLPYRRASFGLDAMELRGSAGPDFAAILSLKDYPDATSPGLLDRCCGCPTRWSSRRASRRRSEPPRASGWTSRCVASARPTRTRWPSAARCSPRATRSGSARPGSATTT
jgi:type IV secretion system protein VirB4